MKHLIITLTVAFLLYPLSLSAQEQQIPPVDKIVVLIEDIDQGMKKVETTIINFPTHPTNLRECKQIADDFEDFTRLEGIAICYYQGNRLGKFEL